MNNMANARNELEKVKKTPSRRSSPAENGPVKTTSPKLSMQEKKERLENSRRVVNVLNSVAGDKLSMGRLVLSDDEYGTDDDNIDNHRGNGKNNDNKGRLTVITKDLFHDDDDDDDHVNKDDEYSRIKNRYLK